MPQLDFDGANSKVSADKIQGQSGTTVTVPTGHTLAGTDANSITINGVNAVAVAPSTSGNVLTSNGSAWASQASAGGGKVLQAIQGAVIRTRVQTTSTSYVSTGLTLNITPSATSSKILVSVHTCVGLGTNGLQRIHLKIVGTTTSSVGDASSETTTNESTICVSPRSADANYAQIPASMQLLDSPNSTSQQTYSLFWKVNSNTANMNAPHTSEGNDSIGISTITAIEVGA
jgi:hypothetical protein